MLQRCSVVGERGLEGSLWKPLYIAAGMLIGRKAALPRLFREKGVVLTAEAQARFGALPERFKNFIAAPEMFVVNCEEGSSHGLCA